MGVGAAAFCAAREELCTPTRSEGHTASDRARSASFASRVSGEHAQSLASLKWLAAFSSISEASSHLLPNRAMPFIFFSALDSSSCPLLAESDMATDGRNGAARGASATAKRHSLHFWAQKGRALVADGDAILAAAFTRTDVWQVLSGCSEVWMIASLALPPTNSTSRQTRDAS